MEKLQKDDVAVIAFSEGRRALEAHIESRADKYVWLTAFGSKILDRVCGEIMGK